VSHGEFVGSLTFRVVIQAVVHNGGAIGDTVVRTVMDDFPLTCTPETELDEVRRVMLQRHARYLPVMEQRTLMGVISFHDVAKAVVDSQDFENRMLKAYIRDWPVEEAEESKGGERLFVRLSCACWHRREPSAGGPPAARLCGAEQRRVPGRARIWRAS